MPPDTWDLESLVAVGRIAGLEPLLAEADIRAERFAAARAGGVADLDVDGLAAAMNELAAIRLLLGRAQTYAYLRHAADVRAPAGPALQQAVRERAAAIAERLRFFEAEWCALDEGDLPDLDDERLVGCRQHLRRVRRRAAHRLPAPVERVLARKDASGPAAWNRLVRRLDAELTVALPDGPRSLDVALARLRADDRDARASAAAAIGAALAPTLEVRAAALDALVHDKATTDELRGHRHWLAARNLANEIPNASAETLVEVVRDGYAVAQLWYALKGRLLGLDRVARWDCGAPPAGAAAPMERAEVEALVIKAYMSLSPEAGGIVAGASGTAGSTRRPVPASGPARSAPTRRRTTIPMFRSPRPGRARTRSCSPTRSATRSTRCSPRRAARSTTRRPCRSPSPRRRSPRC